VSTGAPVLSNTEGSNLTRGVLAALMTDPNGRSASCVFEVDELVLDQVIEATSPRLVVLGNLSRDQLDRLTEVRAVSARWQRMLADLQVRALDGPHRPVVVANADDPLVASAVMPLTTGTNPSVDVVWVAAGQLWTADAASCPRCAAPWSRTANYRCDRCGFSRPLPTWALADDELVGPDGVRRRVDLALPGRGNRANAALAVAAASQWGIDADAALTAISAITHVGGRFATMSVGGVEARLLLAKNPAGWQEMLAEGVGVAGGGPSAPVVLVLNAQGPDGRDTSWIWDVPFEELTDRRVVVSGQRAHDLAVRLRYAEVEFELVEDPLEAVMGAAQSAAPGQAQVDVIANYTAFTSLRRRLMQLDRG
jgi:UDP-N-acetylmuramyl tripeptide synthase